MSLDICKYPWCHDNPQGNRYSQYLPGFPCNPLGVIFLFLFFFFLVIRMLNMRSILLTSSEVHNTTFLLIDTTFVELIHLTCMKFHSHWATHFLQVEAKVLVAQSCPPLCDLMDSSLPTSSAHGILQANTGVSNHSLLWGIFSHQGLNPRLLLCKRILYLRATRETSSPNKVCM